MRNEQSGNCSYVWPENNPEDGHESHQSCCSRTTLSEASLCAWHVPPDKTSLKTVDALREALNSSESSQDVCSYREVLDGAILKGQNINDTIELHNVALRDARVEDTRLSGANLQESDFSRTQLLSVDLSGSDLKKATLSHVTLEEVTISDADLRHADLSNSHLSNVDLRGADLRGADLENAILEEVTMSDADLQRANLTNATITGKGLQGADLSEATLQNTDLADTNLSDTCLINADLRNADLTGVSLQWANFSGANLWKCDLNGVSAEYADFSQSDCRRADFSDAELANAQLDGTDLRGTLFTNAGLYQATFDQARLNSETTFGKNVKYDSFDKTIPNDPKNEDLMNKSAWTHWKIHSLLTDHGLYNQSTTQKHHLEEARLKKLQMRSKLQGHNFVYKDINSITKYFSQFIKFSRYSLTHRALYIGEHPKQLGVYSIFVVLLAALLYPVFGLQQNGLVYQYRLTIPSMDSILLPAVYSIGQFLAGLVFLPSLFADNILPTSVPSNILTTGAEPVGASYIIQLAEWSLGLLISIILGMLLLQRFIIYNRKRTGSDSYGGILSWFYGR